MSDMPFPDRQVTVASANPGFFRVVLAILTAIAFVALPALFALISPVLALPFAAALAFCLANYAVSYAPAVLIFATAFQNLIVSVMSPLITTGETFNLVRGFVFLETVTIWLVVVAHFLRNQEAFSPEIRRYMKLGIAVLCLIGLFAAVGLVRAGGNAIVYTRNIATPVLLFHIGLLTAYRMKLGISAFLVTTGVTILACGYVELLDRRLWLELTNGVSYWALNSAGMMATGYWEAQLKESGFVYRDILDGFRIVLFNTPYLAGVDILRLHGPNVHAISYGYALAFFGLFLFASGRRVLPFLVLPLLLFASVKGAIVEIGFIAAGWAAARLFGARLALIGFCAVALAYIAVVTQVGLNTGDYHVIGLIGGLKGFLTNPIGRGIGVGGNLAGSVTIEEWQKAQAAGSFDGAVESAIGVLLYQMGVAGIAVLAYYWTIAIDAWRLYARSGLLAHGLAAWGTLAVLVNGFFQEEALFAPLAMGLMICFAGMVVGSAARPSPPP